MGDRSIAVQGFGGEWKGAGSWSFPSMILIEISGKSSVVARRDQGQISNAENRLIGQFGHVEGRCLQDGAKFHNSKAPNILRCRGFVLIRATSYSPTHSRGQ